MWIAAALAVAVLACGCAGKGQEQRRQRPGGAAGQSTTPGGAPTQKPLTRAQAIAFAHAVNLRPADVPGFKVSPPKTRSNPRENRLERQMLECVGAAGPNKELAEVDSHEFQRTGAGDFSVSSSVSVARTPAIAARALSVIRSERTRECLSRYVSKLFEHMHVHGAKIGELSVSSEAAAAPGTAGGYVLRIDANVTALGRSVPLSLEMFGFVCGQAGISLMATSLPAPFPAAARQALLQLLLERAKAHGQCVAATSPGSTALPQ